MVTLSSNLGLRGQSPAFGEELALLGRVGASCLGRHVRGDAASKWGAADSAFGLGESVYLFPHVFAGLKTSLVSLVHRK